jgi:threonine/homoserine/homoserine lactone efflux protein
VLEFILTVLFLELTPGPNMTYLATLTLDRGRRAGMLATAGVAAGLTVHALVAAFGLGVLVSRSMLFYDLLRWIGVAYLLYLAWETWQSNAKERPEMEVSVPASLFWRGFFSNVFNPKSILFFISGRPGFIQYDLSSSSLLAQAAGLRAIYIAIATNPCEHRIACEPTEAAAGSKDSREDDSADIGFRSGAGRGLARLVDAPGVASDFHDPIAI